MSGRVIKDYINLFVISFGGAGIILATIKNLTGWDLPLFLVLPLGLLLFNPTRWLILKDNENERLGLYKKYEGEK